jgi:hypothetical protein
LTRCLQTGSFTFAGLDLSSGAPYIPVVKELFREAIGVHTCDRRSSKTAIGEHFTDALFEEGFKEDDPLWDAEKRETNVGMDRRIKVVLDDVFGSDRNVYISVTAHSGAIGGILRGTPAFLFMSFLLSLHTPCPSCVENSRYLGFHPSSLIQCWVTAHSPLAQVKLFLCSSRRKL